MNLEEYEALQKKGEKEVAACKAAGKYPYLPCLDLILEGQNTGTPTNLGLISMPIDRIVGTDTQARAVSFSPSFLPILESGSEFYHKFVTLYESCLEEGLREPVTGFEYMGNYYIREGNKRVAVSKLLGLPCVEGTIQRIIPVYSEDPEVLRNHEYIRFYNATKGLNDLYFSKAGNFKRFREVITGDPSGEFTEEMKENVHSFYGRFSKEYMKHRNPPMPVADAFLEYVSLIGYEELKTKTSEEIEEDMAKLRKELESLTLEEPIAVSEKPMEKEVNIFKKLFRKKSPTRIAFVHKDTVETSAWDYLHNLAKEQLEESELANEVELHSFFGVDIEKAEDMLEQLCEDKMEVIFVTAAEHLPACKKVALEHPKVKILNCSLNASTKMVRTYFLRTYESKYLLGLLAGAHTQTGQIAYIADFPVYGTIASINAFALGVNASNPSARINLYWTAKKYEDPYTELAKVGCDIVSDFDWASPTNPTRRFGLYAIGNEKEPINLAAPLWDWAKLYEEIIKSIRNGNWDVEDAAAGKQSLGYWWGLSSGAMDFIYSNRIPAQTIRLAKFLRDAISDSTYHVFAGELRFQSGEVITPEGHMGYMELIEMDKLLWNIYGSIPKNDQLIEGSIPLTKVQGVNEEEA